MKLQNIKVIAWDFDGTLYPLNDTIRQDMLEAQYRVIMDHTGWSYNETVLNHGKLYKIVYESGTRTAAHLAGISIAKAVFETEKYFDRIKYVSRDLKLIKLFNSLRSYRHIMFVNGKQSQEEKSIIKLGIPLTVFETWITPESTGTVKPDKIATQAILDYTKLPAGNHLVVGDRETVDLIVAHDLGLRTCLVWSDRPGKIADVTVRSVYDVPEILDFI